MAGKAVLTMVASSVCMKKPMATSHSSSLSDCGEGVGVGAGICVVDCGGVKDGCCMDGSQDRWQARR